MREAPQNGRFGATLSIVVLWRRRRCWPNADIAPWTWRGEYSNVAIASQHSKMRAKNAGVQEPSISTAFSGDACSNLHRVQHPAASAEPRSTARAARTLGFCLEQGGGLRSEGASKALLICLELI